MCLLPRHVRRSACRASTIYACPNPDPEQRPPAITAARQKLPAKSHIKKYEINYKGIDLSEVVVVWNQRSTNITVKLSNEYVIKIRISHLNYDLAIDGDEIINALRSVQKIIESFDEMDELGYVKYKIYQ